MPTFRFKADYISSDEIDIEAESEDEARTKFDAGDWDNSAETNTDYRLHELKSVEEIES